MVKSKLFTSVFVLCCAVAPLWSMDPNQMQNIDFDGLLQMEGLTPANRALIEQARDRVANQNGQDLDPQAFLQGVDLDAVLNDPQMMGIANQVMQQLGVPPANQNVQPPAPPVQQNVPPQAPPQAQGPPLPNIPAPPNVPPQQPNQYQNILAAFLGGAPQGGQPQAQQVNLPEWQQGIVDGQDDPTRKTILEGILRSRAAKGENLTREDVADLVTLAGDRAAIQEMRTEMNDPAYRQEMRREMEEQRQDRVQIRDEARQAKINNIRWRNTFLFKKSFEPPDGQNQGAGLHIGFYNSDILRTGLIAGDFVVDYLFYKKLKRERIEYVVKQTEEHAAEILEQIHVVEDDPEAVEYLRKKGLFGRIKAFFSFANPTAKAFIKYLDREYSFVGWNPLKKEIFLPVVAMLLTQEVSRKLHKQAEYVDTDHIESRYSYAKDENGVVQQLNGGGMSVISMLQFLRAPGSTLAEHVFNLDDIQFSIFRYTSDFFGKIVGWEQPRIVSWFLQNSWSPFVCRLLVHLSAVMFFDGICNDLWRDYFIDGRRKMAVLLSRYLEAKENADREALEKVRAQLRAHIEKGHDAVSAIPLKNLFLWLKARMVAKFWRRTILAGIVVGPIVICAIPIVYRMIKAVRRSVERNRNNPAQPAVPVQ